MAYQPYFYPQYAPQPQPQGQQGYGFNNQGNSYYPMQNAQIQGTQPAQQSPQTIPVQMLKGWPVSSRQEAENAMIELDGTTFIFPDFGNGVIYTKQFNLRDCKPVFGVYQIPAGIPAEQPVSEFAPASLTGDFQAMQRKMVELEKQLEDLKTQQGEKNQPIQQGGKNK